LTGGEALPDRLRSYFDLTVAALACDATRVATIDLDNGGTNHTWVDHPGASAAYHGGFAHDGSAEGFKKVAAIERWAGQPVRAAAAEDGRHSRGRRHPARSQHRTVDEGAIEWQHPLAS